MDKKVYRTVCFFRFKLNHAKIVIIFIQRTRNWSVFYLEKKVYKTVFLPIHFWSRPQNRSVHIWCSVHSVWKVNWSKLGARSKILLSYLKNLLELGWKNPYELGSKNRKTNHDIQGLPSSTPWMSFNYVHFITKMNYFCHSWQMPWHERWIPSSPHIHLTIIIRR